MKKLLHFFSLLLSGIFLSQHLSAQYLLNGSATTFSCSCYTLTTEKKYDSGSVWNANKIDLNNSFDFHFNVYLGCIDAKGADGMAFVIQKSTTALGHDGEGMGFESISPSVGISLDTWQNTNRKNPAYDHISIQLNGNITDSNDLAGPVQASVTNASIKDCKWHVLRVVWDASTKIIAAYFDGQFRLQAQYDLVANVFHNDPNVYWGFTAATGGGYNLQQFCASLNPELNTNLADTFTCIDKPLVFMDQSQSFSTIKDYYWDFGDGTTSSVPNPPPHSYSEPGAYKVKHTITGLDGCVSDTMIKNIEVGAKPIADFSLFDTCTDKLLGITERSVSSFGPVSQWAWWLDRNLNSKDSLPAIYNLSQGSHELTLVERSTYGCMSDTVSKNFSVHATPVVNIIANDGCREQPIHFSALQIDNSTNIIEWTWQFDDGQLSHEQDPLHIYSQGGHKKVHLTAFANDGCMSNDTAKEIYVQSIYANAGKDTSVQSNVSFTLGGSWNGDFSGSPVATWSPPLGLNTIDGLNPVATLQNDQLYYLKVSTTGGCTARDSVRINIFNSPGVLVPNAFTPNHDGLNDILRPRFNGIQRLDYFAVYDRWGQLVFETRDMKDGWNGNLHGQPLPPQTFVWIISAEDFKGRKYQLKGTTTIIR